MENASKALIIAGTTLIGVLILTTMIYLFRAAAKTNENYDERQLQQQLQLYNSKFEYYNRDYNSILDMVSLINLAYDSNVASDYDSQKTVQIKIKIQPDSGTGFSTFYLVLPNSKDKMENLKKNQIYKSNNKNTINTSDENIIDIYSLINDNLYTLEISDIKKPDNLSTSDANKMFRTDTLSLSRLDKTTQTTVYKYWFECDSSSITYNKITGRISNMEFILKHMNGTSRIPKNPDDPDDPDDPYKNWVY